MFRRIIFITTLLFGLYNVHSEVVILKNGDKLSGTITSSDESSIKLQSRFGVLTISKFDIDKVYYDDEEYYKEKYGVSDDKFSYDTKKGKISVNNGAVSDAYKMYIKKRNTGIALLVTGGAFFWIVGPLFHGSSVLSAMFGNYIGIVTLNIFGALFELAGLIISLTSSAAFVVASRYYAEHKSKSAYSMLLDYDAKNELLTMGLKFKLL